MKISPQQNVLIISFTFASKTLSLAFMDVHFTSSLIWWGFSLKHTLTCWRWRCCEHRAEWRSALPSPSAADWLWSPTPSSLPGNKERNTSHQCFQAWTQIKSCQVNWSMQLNFRVKPSALENSWNILTPMATQWHWQIHVTFCKVVNKLCHLNFWRKKKRKRKLKKNKIKIKKQTPAAENSCNILIPVVAVTLMDLLHLLQSNK